MWPVSESHPDYKYKVRDVSPLGDWGTSRWGLEDGIKVGIGESERC